MITLFLLAQLTIAIPAGSHRPLYGRATDAPATVAAFRIDRDAVTRAQYLAFVRAHPAWRRSAVTPALATPASYLTGWRGDLDAGGAGDARRPVTSVSWFAAGAYCRAQGKRLPSVTEWEYVAAASATRRDASRDPAFIQQLVSRYATRPRPLPPVDAGEVNAFGVRGLHGIAWEWTSEVDGRPVRGHAHAAGAAEHDLYCASAAIGAADPTNYAAFLRSAVRGGLTGRTTMETLGFRCAS